MVHVRPGILTVCSPREGRTDSNQASGTAPGTTAPRLAWVPLQKWRCGLCCAGHFHPYSRGNIHSVRPQGCGHFIPRTRQLLEGIGVHADVSLYFGDSNHRFPGKSHPDPAPQASLLVDRTAIPCRSSQRSEVLRLLTFPGTYIPHSRVRSASTTVPFKGLEARRCCHGGPWLGGSSWGRKPGPRRHAS